MAALLIGIEEVRIRLVNASQKPSASVVAEKEIAFRLHDPIDGGPASPLQILSAP
jgi:hypothetical protein